jgi:hypothetical protein
VLVNPHDRAVDHLDLAAMRLGDYVHQPVPDPGLAPVRAPDDRDQLLRLIATSRSD